MPDPPPGPGHLLGELDAEDIRDAVRDLGACLMLPAMWAGREPREIVGGLLDVLVSILRVDVAYVHFEGPGAVVEERRPHHLPAAATLGEALAPPPGAGDTVSRRLRLPAVADDELQVVGRRIGLEGLGTVALGSRRATFPTALERFLLDATVNQAAVALQTAGLLDDLRERDRVKDELYERERTARRRAESSERHARFLAEASSLLTSSLDVDTILGRLARLAVPVLADLCAVDMLTPQGAIARVAVAHVDPAREDLARVLRERYPFHPDDIQGVSLVIRTGTRQFWPDVTDELLRERARDAAQVELMMRIGVRSAVIVPLVARGRTLGALTFVLGEGTRRYTEAELVVIDDLARRAALAIDNARLYREAEAARAEAEAASRAKDEFLAVLSHELRTPLNAVLGWARMLRAAPPDAAMLARGLEVVERNAEAQTQLIEDLLDMARITTGKLRLDVGPVELVPVIQAAIDALRPAAAAKSIRLEAILHPRAGPIAGDPTRLQQVVWNLVSNAVKFTGRDGRVQIRLQRAGSHVEIVVSDTGKGIAADVLPTVFDRFTQADSSSTRSHGGLGLGLALVRHLVELHGGSVGADSPGEGQGATFRVRLPLMVHPEGALPDSEAGPAAPSSPAAPTPLQGVRVVVVDDDRDARELFKMVLVRHGAEVRVAGSAAEALATLAAWPATVLLSDIEMQAEDGYDLIRRVRALPPDRGGAIPAAAVTAYGRVEDRVRALGAGFQIHVPKPVEPRELVAVVENLARVRWRAS